MRVNVRNLDSGLPVPGGQAMARAAVKSVL